MNAVNGPTNFKFEICRAVFLYNILCWQQLAVTNNIDRAPRVIFSHIFWYLQQFAFCLNLFQSFAIETYWFLLTFGLINAHLEKSRMDFFAVYLECKRFIVIKKEWIEDAIVGKSSRVFFSPNSEEIPVFHRKARYYLNTEVDSFYNAFIFKAFSKKKILWTINGL